MTTVSSKGQVTIPIVVRQAMGLGAGSRVEFVQNERGEFTMIAMNRSIRELKGCAPALGRFVSVEEMNEAIAEQGASAG